MNLCLSIIAVVTMLLWAPINVYAQDNEGDIDEKKVGRLSTATPYEKVKEKKITKYYKSHGVLQDNIWEEWLSKNYSEVYVIQKGDTLWDISDKFLDSPWYWPKIWEMNLYITNPHWIYPGNELKFSYSGKTGPTITVVPKRKRSGVDYSVLEREKPASLFDENDFYKSRYRELMASNNTGSVPIFTGGYVCLGEAPTFYGLLESSSKGTNMFSEEDTVDIFMEKMATCEKGARYAAVEVTDTHVYKINGILEIQDKAFKQGHCVAKVLEIYGLVKRKMQLIKVPEFDTNPKNVSATLIADITSMEPYKKELSSENDRICVKFRNNVAAPEPGSMVYFYEIKDPEDGKEVDPYVLAAGQIIHTNKGYATVLVVASEKARAITKKTIVTTRF